MFRLFGFLAIFALAAGGFTYFDYKLAVRASAKDDADSLTFSEYLSGLSGRLANLGGGAGAPAGLPTRLADMLPKPPEGWSVRDVDPADAEGFLPKDSKRADGAAIAAVKAVTQGETGSGVETAAVTYEKGDRKLIIQAMRYPNVIFAGPEALQQRIDLQKTAAQFRGTEFATVRGLDLTEDLLPEGFRGRMFLADVAGQIHLRILAPKRMTDQDLLPFLQTLHVEAMNASVVDKTQGLGSVPVIVLASALDDTAREAYLADVAARATVKAARIAAEQAEADAAALASAQAEAAPSSGGLLGNLFGGEEAAPEAAAVEAPPEKSISCSTDKDGVKRCKVQTAEPAAD